MGGRATRMGGGDKALLEIAGRSVLDRLLERFGPQVGALALSANGDPARFSKLGLPVLPDDGAVAGPLAGILAGLAWAVGIEGVTHLATVPGDAPCPAENLVARLAAAAGRGAAAAHGPDGVEPLHALWPVSALENLRGLAAEGLGSPKRALERLEAAPVVFTERRAFLDLDEPADLARAERLLRGD